MAGTLSPVGKQYFTDNNGAPLSGGSVYTYEAGTSTPATTYQDSDLLTPNSNPIVLDSAGRCVIYLETSSYKYVVYDAAGTLIWSQDNITSVASTSTLGEVFYFAGSPEAPINGTSYSVGATYAALHAGTNIWSIDSAFLPGTYALVGMLMAPTGETITAAIVNLSDGSPQTPLATISTTNDVGVRVQSGTITFAASGTAKSYGIKVIVTAGVGFAWGFSVNRIS